MFDVKRGDIHNASQFNPGTIPLVSCSTRNNGILSYLDISDVPIYDRAVTVAYNGSPLTARYHPYRFVAKDDVAVLIPKEHMTLEAVLFVISWFSMQTWRYSYYRKCYQAKLTRLEIPMPATSSGLLDSAGLRDLARTSPYWEFLRSKWSAGDTETVVSV